MEQLELQLESIPGYGLAVDALNDYAGDHFNNTNPFEDEHGNKRRLDRASTTEDERRLWKHIQRLAWVHDRCFLGLCGVGLDCGIGLVPLAVFFVPLVGPLVTYVVHTRLVTIAQSGMVLPVELEAKMHLNIVVDLLISLPPVIGGFLSWLNGCLTRNAGMLFCYMERCAREREQGGVRYVGTRLKPLYHGVERERNYNARPGGTGVQVGSQHAGVR